MKKEAKWLYQDGKLVSKETTKTSSDGTKEIVHQKAHSGFLGERFATEVTSRVKSTK
jgi:hypothetical protein